jgi:hypothetical protein
LTRAEVMEDEERLTNITMSKKIHADTMISTTHFIKKSVMVPIEEELNVHVNTEHPFKRGIMTFDDFSYN